MWKKGTVKKAVVMVCMFGIILQVSGCQSTNKAQTEVNEDVTKEVTLSEPITMYTTYVTKVREEPSKDADVCALLAEGDQVTVTGYSDETREWSCIEYEEKTAYVDSTLLSETNAAE